MMHFRKTSSRVSLAAFAIGLHLSAGAALAQEEAAGSCAGRLEVDLGFSSYDCISCVLHGADGWIEFGAEPGVMAVDPRGRAAGLLQDGDRIVAVDGELITSRSGALRLARAQEGDFVVLTVRRQGAVLDVAIEAGTRCAPGRAEGGSAERPKAGPAAFGPAPPRRASGGRGRLGFAVRCEAPCTAERLETGEVRWSFAGPPMIVRIEPDGPAAEAGVFNGDVLVEVDGSPVTSPRAGSRFGSLRPGDRVELGVRRDGRLTRVVVVAR